jgi:arylsulfatase A-like enzyme
MYHFEQRRGRSPGSVRPHCSSCPQCSATDAAKLQRLGSEILWLICAKCAHVWCSVSDPTLAEVLKSQGYVTAQFGKNHLGDRNEFLPTNHGFDEWFGNLYHLNAEEEPEQLDYPGHKYPEYLKKFGPRGVLHAWATDKEDPTEDPKFGRVGKQRIENTGALTRKRMETFDSEVLDHTLAWLDKQGKGDAPFFCWFNTSACHVWSHPQQKYVQMAVDEGRAEEDVFRAKMIEHDEHVGVLLKKLEDMDVADNTIVLYTTDNGNELIMWPDGGYAPFRGEKEPPGKVACECRC